MRAVKITDEQHETIEAMVELIKSSQTPESKAAKVSMGYVARLAMEHGLNVLRSQLAMVPFERRVKREEP